MGDEKSVHEGVESAVRERPICRVCGKRPRCFYAKEGLIFVHHRNQVGNTCAGTYTKATADESEGVPRG